MSSEIQLKQIKKNVYLSVFVQLVSFFVSAVLNLLLPKFIDEYEYSYWQTFLLYVSYVPLLHLGFLDGLMLRYSQFDLKCLNKSLIRAQFKIFIAFECVFSACCIGVSQLFFDGVSRILLTFIGFAIVTTNVFTYTSYLFQLTNRINNYAILVLILRILLGVGVFFVILIGGSRFYEICIAYFVAHIAAISWGCLKNRGLYLGKSDSIRNGWREFKENISSGGMLLVANLSSMLLVGGAKMVVQWRYDALTFGQVAFSFNISNLFLTFITAASIAVFPSLKRLDENRLPEFYGKIRNKITPWLFVSLLAYFPGFYILNIWLPNYSSSLLFLGILMPIIVYSSRVTLLTNNYLKALRKEKIMLTINLVSVIVAFVFFGVFAFVFNSILLILLSLVSVIMIHSIVSEIVVMKVIKRPQNKKIIIEVILTCVFIFLTMMFNGVM